MNENLEKTTQSLLKRYNDAQESLGQLSQKLDITTKLLEVLKLEKKQWQLEKIKQQKIISDTLNKSNKLHQEDLVEIQRLREKLRAYGYID